MIIALFSFICLFLSVVFVAVPKYLELRKVVGIDKFWERADGIAKNLIHILWGLKTQISATLSALLLILPDLLHDLMGADMTAVFEADKAKMVSFWLMIASIVFHAYGMASAARKQPVVPPQ